MAAAQAPTAAAVGIDLGTTVSCVAVWDAAARAPRLLPCNAASVFLPSVVWFPDDGGDTCVGAAAYDALASGAPGTFVQDAKRFIGMRAPLTPKHKAMARKMPHPPLPAPEGGVRWAAAWHPSGFVTPVDAAAELLRHMAAAASRALGQGVRDVVVSVPAHFHTSQRTDTETAVAQAGLQLLRLVNEPSAAAMAVDLPMDGVGVVADWGGGTLDVTLVCRRKDGVHVLGIAGHPALGGRDVDAALVRCLLQPGQTPNLREVQRAKHDIVSQGTGMVAGRAVSSIELQRACHKIQGDIAAITKEALRQTTDPAQRVVFVGGSSRVSWFRDVVLAAAGLTDAAVVHVDDPDAVVGMGAAVVAAGHLGLHSQTLMDVLQMSIGVLGEGGACVPVVPRGTPLPAHVVVPIANQKDGQHSVRVTVLEGDAPAARDNHVLGVLDMHKLTPDMRGGTVLRLQVRVNASGRVHAHLQDAGVQRTREVTLSVSDTALPPPVHDGAPREVGAAHRLTAALSAAHDQYAKLSKRTVTAATMEASAALHDAIVAGRVLLQETNPASDALLEALRALQAVVLENERTINFA